MLLQFPRSLGPAVAHVSATEAVRAGLGALIGLGLTGLFLLSPQIDLDLGLYLVAPFGATSVLLFAVPNSPLAQPWSAVVGNTVAALVGVAVCLTVADPALRIGLAVGLAITATILCRAVHPPAGAVAMTAAMSPEAVDRLGFWFALAPVAAGTVALVAIAALYARLTGRHYPFRQFDDRSKHQTGDRNPSERLGLSEDELSGLLESYSQSFNLGVEDLARLIGAAELQAAAQTSGPLAAEDIMSRDLITIGPDTGLGAVADLFRRHRITSLPVVGPEGRFLGVIFQLHLISQARDDALRLDRGFLPALRRLLDRTRDRPVTAGEIMSVAGPRATTKTPVGALLPMMADGDVDAVPVVEYGRVVGMVTRTDLIGALARSAVRMDQAPGSTTSA
ncbi:HPP family protein [Roseivivax sediminis]|uniref:CBS domain-containing membrane protein n=1 Tax=Roseivivax sediminis TaxID=936889 RepID=A0A1I1YLU8_9RHOB|nr:HPP family protein [Roseivivax sediminis]SFE20516.1 CBS domain-containing membrane protein [Roseivivax sediminis]